MYKDQVDPMEPDKEIVFRGDPIILTELGNVVTVRKAQGGDDKYDEYKAGDLFKLLLESERQRANLGTGQVAAHWKLPFNEIPDEILCGEEFPQGCLHPRFRVREEMRAILTYIYGEFEEDSLFHAIVYVYPDEIFEKIAENFNINSYSFRPNPDLFVREFLRQTYLQREGETPEEWMNRKAEGYDKKNLADVFFGFNNSYKALKSYRRG